MNCTVCTQQIEKGKGYYLVAGVPYCQECYRRKKNGAGSPSLNHALPAAAEAQNLLDAFRAYQKKERNAGGVIT